MAKCRRCAISRVDAKDRVAGCFSMSSVGNVRWGMTDSNRENSSPECRNESVTAPQLRAGEMVASIGNRRTPDGWAGRRSAAGEQKLSPVELLGPTPSLSGERRWRCRKTEVDLSLHLIVDLSLHLINGGPDVTIPLFSGDLFPLTDCRNRAIGLGLHSCH